MTNILSPTPIPPPRRSNLLGPEEDQIETCSPTLSQLFDSPVPRVSCPPHLSPSSTPPSPRRTAPQAEQHALPPHPIPTTTANSSASEFADPPKRDQRGRTSASLWFLTYPQNETDPAVAMDRLKQIKYGVLWAIVSREIHQDGNHHLHIVVQFSKRIFVRDLNPIFDPIANKHGNYTVVRNLQASIRYVKKEDFQPITFGKVPEKKPKTAKQLKSDIIAGKLRSGQTIQDIDKEEGGFVLNNLKKILQYQAFLMIHGQTRLTATHQVTLEIGPTGNEAERTVHTWLLENMGKRDRPLKTKQLYIQGPSNHNKTGLVKKLGEFYKYYPMSPEETFDDHYNDETYDLVILDEFSARCKRSPQSLNAFSDGSLYIVPQKGSQYMKRINLPMIILSNDEPTCLWKGIFFQTFQVRFTYVILDQPLDLDLIQIRSTPLSS